MRKSRGYVLPMRTLPINMTAAVANEILLYYFDGRLEQIVHLNTNRRVVFIAATFKRVRIHVYFRK